MFKKILPVILLVFVTACADIYGGSSSVMPCCEKCECCKDRKCAECCKSGECKCCKDGMCKMCMGKIEGMPSMKKGKQCLMINNGAKDGKPCSCCEGMMKDGMNMKSSPAKTAKPKTTDDADHKQHHPAQ